MSFQETSRVLNFNAGPAAMPLPVLQRVQEELVSLPGAGMSVMELSHRSARFESINDGAIAAVKKLLGAGDEYSVLFLQGGASLQFAMAPMNLLDDGARAEYLLTGDWGKKAFAEAQKVAHSQNGEVQIATSTKESGFDRVPRADEYSVASDARYLHFTSNETIGGVQWQCEPENGGVPLVCDASSDIFSRPIDIAKYGILYGGAQKNVGPSGVTLAIIREDMLRETSPDLPTMLDYKTHVKSKSLYNTPNTFGIYVIGLVCEWIESLGGLPGMRERAEQKAAMLYDVIDSGEFYRGHAEKESRSRMNVTFRLKSEELEKRFASQAEAAGFVGLKGHRSVGGLRASIYNALPPESVAALAEFMKEFEITNG